jgi:molybdopterin converting factor small subunit
VITVKFSASLRDLTGGDEQIQVDAPTVRRLIKLLDERYPGISERLSESTSVAINGEILPDALYEDIPDDAEVHFLATLAGG